MSYKEEHTYMRKSVSLDDHPKIEGIDFEKNPDIKAFLESFITTGFQATNLGKGISIVNKMIDDEAKIFLSMTGNVISSGLREIITYLCKHNKIHGIVTSAAGIEEDIIKCFKPFVVGDFEIPGRTLFESGVGRIGNILAPFDRYLYFEEFIGPILDKLENNITVTELTKLLGEKVDNEESYLYWAAKNKIPVYCPAIQDGSLGDLLYYVKKRKPDFVIDTLADTNKLINELMHLEKVGVIVLGGGSAKHFLLNSAILREGFDYAVYITTAQEYDGSDSGGNQEEAKTWAKIKINASTVKIKCEFTIAFPLLVAGSFL